MICYYKSKKLFWLITPSIFSLPFIIFIRIISPIKKITIEGIYFDRIGHATYYPDWFLIEKKNGYHDKTLNLFCQNFGNFVDPRVDNIFWYKLWKRHLSIIPFVPFGFSIYFWHQKLPGKKLNQTGNFDLHLDPTVKEFKYNLSERKKKKLSIIFKGQESNIFLKKDELSKGYELLEKINIPKNSNFICIQNRDNIHIYSHHQKVIKLFDLDWSHNNYRNSNIDNYLKAAENLISDNTFAIFTGWSTINTNKILSDKIIQYKKTKIDSDFMDIFLASQCKFYICSDSGIAGVAYCFRKPLVITNCPTIRRIYVHSINSIFILKKFFSKSQKRFLSFKEILNIENEVGDFGTKKFKKNFSDIYILENSPDEIDEAAQEMKKRIDGTWVDDPKDIDLQNMFWKINKMNNIKNKKLLIGTKFLRKYEYLLN